MIALGDSVVVFWQENAYSTCTMKTFRFANPLLRTVYKYNTGRRLLHGVTRWVQHRTVKIPTHSEELNFCGGLGYTTWRAQTLLTKEPETIRWILEMPSDSIFWDVGANIGIYSVFAAKIRKNTVIAIEPSFVNLTTLAENVRLNGLSSSVLILPLALSDFDSPAMLSMDNVEIGHSNNQISNGTNQTELFNRVLVASIDSLIKNSNVQAPTHIKIDVDGIELEILKGAEKALKDVISLCVERPVDNRKVLEINEFLQAAGFRCHHEGRVNGLWSRLT